MEEIIYFYNVKDGKYYQSRYTHRWLNNLEQRCKKQKEVINKVNKYIEKHSFFVNDTWYNKKIGYPKDTFNAQEVLDMLKEVSE
jgi:hypothetical protein